MSTEVGYVEDDNVPLEAILPVDLTEGTGVDYVQFQMEHKETGKFTEGKAKILDYTDGRVAYEFGDTDVEEDGIYYIEWDVYWNNGRKETFPKGISPDKLMVRDRLGD